MKVTFNLLGFAVVLIMIAACAAEQGQVVTMDPIDVQQDYRFESPEGTVKAKLLIQGDVSSSFQIFVSDGLFTSRFDYPAGPVEDTKEFDWYDSPLLINYIPNPEQETTGTLSVECRFGTIE